MALANLDVAAAQALLDRLRPVPLAGEPEGAALTPHGDAGHVGATRLALVRHCELDRCVSLDRGGRERVGDVLDARLSAECADAGRRGRAAARLRDARAERCDRVALDLVHP